MRSGGWHGGGEQEGGSEERRDGEAEVAASWRHVCLCCAAGWATGRLASLLSLVVVLGDLVQGSGMGCLYIVTTGVQSVEVMRPESEWTASTQVAARLPRRPVHVDRAGRENSKQRNPPAMSEDESTYVRSTYLCRHPPEK